MTSFYADEYERDAHHLTAEHFGDASASFRASIRNSSDPGAVMREAFAAARARDEAMRPAREAAWAKVCAAMRVRAAECRTEWLSLCEKHGWTDDGRFSA